MKEVLRSSQFKKDFKRYRNQLEKVKKLLTIVQYLEQEISIPVEYKPHKLSGNYKGYMECHIEDDFLLIWIDEASNIVKLVRLGTHHELFGK